MSFRVYQGDRHFAPEGMRCVNIQCQTCRAGYGEGFGSIHCGDLSCQVCPAFHELSMSVKDATHLMVQPIEVGCSDRRNRGDTWNMIPILIATDPPYRDHAPKRSKLWLRQDGQWLLSHHNPDYELTDEELERSWWRQFSNYYGETGCWMTQYRNVDFQRAASVLRRELRKAEAQVATLLEKIHQAQAVRVVPPSKRKAAAEVA